MKTRIVVNKKMTLIPEEKNNVILGNIEAKKTETYKKAKEYFEKSSTFYSQIGTLSTSETKLWFDYSNYAVKMQFVIIEIDKAKHEEFSKNIDKVFGEMSKDIDETFANISKKIDALFKNLEPKINNAFNDLFGGFREDDQTKKK